MDTAKHIAVVVLDTPQWTQTRRSGKQGMLENFFIFLAGLSRFRYLVSPCELTVSGNRRAPYGFPPCPLSVPLFF